MPKLEVLELFGFKSFADKTEVRFDAGVTAIVGPNGCGKSNIADAINWVVGEQSAKSLRADKMEDVIFNGTSKRKALGFTEVTLQLNSFERVLPATNGEPEVRQIEPVAITRRMYRSGESEYYITGKRCRLKDIYELFEGTGLGHNSYALIEQGRIDQILSAKPQERRALIEEAARVSVFKGRKKAAEIKLELAQQNLVRVNDIILEVRRQADALKRQAAKARRYGRLREELRHLHRTRIYLDFSQFSGKLSQLNAQLEQLHEQDRDLLQQNRDYDARRVQLAASLQDLESRIQVLREDLSKIDVDAERADQQIHFQGQQIQESRRRSVEAGERAATVMEKMLSLEDRQLERIGQLEEERGSLQACRQEAELIRRQLETVQQDMEGTQQEIERLRHHAITHADQLARLRNESVRLAENRTHLVRQRERIQKDLERVAADKAALLERLQASRLQLAEAGSQWDAMRQQAEDLAQQLAALEARQEQSAQELTGLSDQYSMQRHRLASLEEVERRRSNYSEGMQKFLTSAATQSLRVAGTVADLVEAKPEFEAIIEDYLNEQLQYVVVDNLSEAIRGVEHVKEIKAGKCTFMSLMGLNGHSAGDNHEAGLVETTESGVLGRLRDQLDMDPALERALRRVFPDFSSTFIVQDMDAVVRLSHQYPECAFLTLGGEYLSARGLLSAVGARKDAAGLLSLRREKRELQEEGVKLQLQLEEARAGIALLRARIRETQETLAISQRELHQSELDKTRLQQNVSSLDQEFEKLEQSERVYDLEEQRVGAEQIELEAHLSGIEAEILQLENTSQSSENSMADLAARLSEKQVLKETAALKLAEARMDMAALQERVRSMEKECERYAQEHSDLEAQRLQAANEAAESDALIQRLVESNQSLTEALSRLRSERESKSNAWRELLAAQQQAKEEAATLEMQLEELRARRDGLRQRLSELEVERARCETELEALNRGCLEEFHVPSHQLAAEMDASTLTLTSEEAHTRYAELRSRIENFGAINMSALEEFQAHEERLQFLLTQQADIQNSIATTQKTIEEINRHCLQQFNAAFTQINAHFVEVFSLLFNGGHAEMRLLDENDPMESGIEIIASPPGKRLQNIMLLSGGEKALTALALLMGIFKFCPGPFCVLDEVDAPLDDANVQRFTNMLQQMSGNTQFVVITHNKKTLEAAQFLYGVTMQEAGVSKIVSVRFN